ncbi:MAG: hypothetical protein H0W11_09275 [Gemmatimonadetes bacterium]|nr:hypothetical protein [Gemmatimonadota bacterium]
MIRNKHLVGAGSLLLAAALLGACRDSVGPGNGGTIPAGAAVISTNITQDRTLYRDTVYTLRGFVKVANNATLTIQDGTRIEGDYEVLGSSLFVLRGARIRALGTRERPIVFTSSRPVGQRASGDWGGLIIVGNGVINRIPDVVLEGTGTDQTLNPPVVYSGGNNNDDNSGTLRYVRVEYAGYATAQDAELNSLTLAAVGRGTTVEYVQVLRGLDDSFEWFGGAVNGKYLVSYESGDDHFDASEGYVGLNQFMIAYQSGPVVIRPGAGSAAGDAQGIENDGCAPPAQNPQSCPQGQNSQPHTIPVFANFTLIGPGTGTGQESNAGGIGMMLRRGTGGHYINGVVARYPRAAVSLRDENTRTRVTEGDLTVRNLVLAENAIAFQPQTGTTVQFALPLEENAITEAPGTAGSLFARLPATPTGAPDFDWSPAGSSPIASGGLTAFPAALQQRVGTFIAPTPYRGAAAPGGEKWWEGWTYYAVR